MATSSAVTSANGRDGTGHILIPGLEPAKEFLPDSRAKTERNVLRSPLGNLCLIFCANCGIEAARVKAGEATAFAFVLCPSCAMQWGMIAHRLAEPHHEAWMAVARAQSETHGRILSREEVAKLLDDVNDPIAKLIR